jgi:hypothetical protein
MFLTYDETMLMAIYNTGSREGLIEKLTEMRSYLEIEEEELRFLTDSAIGKLRKMTDAEFAELDLVPDFDEEGDSDAG